MDYPHSMPQHLAILNVFLRFLWMILQGPLKWTAELLSTPIVHQNRPQKSRMQLFRLVIISEILKSERPYII